MGIGRAGGVCGSPARAVPLTTRAQPATTAADVSTAQQTTGTVHRRRARRTVPTIVVIVSSARARRTQARGDRSVSRSQVLFTRY
jgi:hypothetical protein